ncbi:MAG: MBL fold metallo-hydrolase, partial [Bacteroidota bacterium]
MKITFWGAARQVTGSMHVLDLPGGTRVLIDCGLDYENRKEFEAKNERFPFDPESIDLVVLTHAHIDHSGNLPNLIRQGFSGRIVSTAPTLLLSEYLLNDSLNIQRMELAAKEKAIRRKRGMKGKNIRLQPLYAKKHIQDFVDMAVQVDYDQSYVFNEELRLSLHQAGHILGAASVRFEVTHGNV